jgi:arginine/lysine/ornithine decarboxylase
MISDQSRMPLVEAMEGHMKGNPISFHVPGHKNGLLIKGDRQQEFLRCDLTELSGLDDLHEPAEAIAEAEQLLSDYYKTKKSYFLVNGSTVGNLASIMSSCKQGEVVFVQRNCHKSVLHGIRLAKAVPVFLETEWDAKSQTALGVSLDTVKSALEQFPQAKACVLTYPTYYGLTYPIQAIIKELHKYGILVIIDEAHGPHFGAWKGLPLSTLQMGADLVVHSAHKMLPAMTMGSFLHINNDRVNKDIVKSYVSMLQSSSPSYPIMASLDYARYYIACLSREEIRLNQVLVDKFIHSLESIDAMLKVVRTDDPLKVLVRWEGVSGYDFQRALEMEGVYTELADPYQVLFILPLVKTKVDFPFKEALEKISCAIKNTNIDKREIKLFEPLPRINKISSLALSLEEMEVKKEKWIRLEDSIGYISSQMVIPYPPGIPTLIPGERVTEDKVKIMKSYWENGAKIQGNHRLDDGQIAVYDMLEVEG